MRDLAVVDDTLWFMNGLVRVRVAAESGSDCISVIEQAARKGDSPPLHVHGTEDELFQIIEGELRFRCGEEQQTVAAGEFLFVPKGVAHSFVVTSAVARWLITTTKGDYEAFVRELARTPEGEGWPEPVAVTAEMQRHLRDVGRKYGIEFVGPSLV